MVSRTLRWRSRAALSIRPLALGLAVGLLSAAPAALAQQPQPDPVTEVARARFNDGVTLYGQGKYKEARDAFLQAYALKRVPAVLLNLGQSEVKGGFHEDGGNHLQQFLREHKPIKPEEKEAADRGIAEAKKKTAYVILSVDAAGADVSIDGVSIGKAPLLDPWFVKAGKHTAFATFAGKNASAQFDAKVGQSTLASLTLGVAVSPPPQPPPPQPPPQQPPPQPTQQQPPPYYPPPQQPPPYYQPQPLPPPQPTAPPPEQPSQREDFLEWYKKKPIAWVGTGVTGAGLLTGVIGAIAFGVTTGKANSDAKAITDYAAQNNLGRAPCGEQSGGGDAPGYEANCNILRSDLANRDSAAIATAVGFVVMGLGAIGTVTYVMVDWFPGKKQQPATGLRVFPLVSPTEGGVGLRGRF